MLQKKQFDEVHLLKDKPFKSFSAQILVTGGGNHKKKLLIDYSETVNK